MPESLDNMCNNGAIGTPKESFTLQSASKYGHQTGTLCFHPLHCAVKISQGSANTNEMVCHESQVEKHLKYLRSDWTRQTNDFIDQVFDT